MFATLALAFLALGVPVIAPAAARAASTGLGAVGFGTITVDNARQHVFVSEPKANAVEEFDFAGNLVASVPNVYGAWGMTISGNFLYVAESTAGAIVRLDLTSSTLSPQTLATGLNDPVWLVMTGGKLWTTVGGSQSGSVESVDPTSGSIAALPGSYYDPDLAVSPGDPNTLFVAQDGLSPGSIYRFDVSSSPPTQTAYSLISDDGNIQDLAVSPDGTRVIPAAGAPYLFEEFSAASLQPDGLRYPGNPYPSAVAVSASGLLATGLDHGYSSPDISVYPLGTPASTWCAATNNPDGTANVLPHGLALSADGSKLFAVTDDESGNVYFTALAVGATSSGCQTVTTGNGGQGAGAGPPTTSPGSGGIPQTRITPKNPRSHRPDVYLELTAIRVERVLLPTYTVVGYRFYFAARDIRCINGATNVIFTIGHSRHIAPCRRGLILIGAQVAPHKTYRIRVQAVKMRKHKIVKRGPSYLWRAYMPGNEAKWTPLSHIPPTY